jgi:hypothetical protein
LQMANKSIDNTAVDLAKDGHKLESLSACEKKGIPRAVF